MSRLQDASLLIVEDNKKAQEQLGEILSDYVKELFQAYDGAEALEIYREYKPDIILSDIRMPIMDGLSMAKKIKEMDPHQPVMLLTAHSEQAMLLEAANISIDGYLTKPIADLNQLLESLERLAEKGHHLHKKVQESVQKIEKEYQAKIQRLQQHSLYDHLTRMPNRHYFSKKLKESIAHARQAHSDLALFYIDLDNLKQINDQHGHQVGDHAIKKTVNNIHEAIGSKDFFARIGGDEFALIVETAGDEAELTKLAKEILLAASLPVFFSQTELNLSCSIGISRYPQDAQDMLELIHCADQAMYAVKHGGKNGYHFWQASPSAS